MGFPHIIDEILSHKASWIAMRGTCKEFYERINSMMYRNIVVTPVFRDAADSDDSDDDASDYASVDSDEESGCLEPLLLDVSSPSFTLPDFKPRYYDSIWGYSAKDSEQLEVSASLFKTYTRVLEMPIQLNFSDMVWFETEGGRSTNLTTGRFFVDPDLWFRDGCEQRGDVNGYRTHIIPMMLSKIVLLPATSKSAPKSHSSIIPPPISIVSTSTLWCDKTVSHVLYSSLPGFTYIGRDLDWDGEVPRSPTNMMVYIFTRMENPEWVPCRWNSLVSRQS
jgi:hypothetical protein